MIKIAGAVTVPFKKKSFLTWMSLMKFLFNQTQSVNTLHKVGDKIIGYNTDSPGFLKTNIRLLWFSKIEKKLDFHPITNVQRIFDF